MLFLGFAVLGATVVLQEPIVDHYENEETHEIWSKREVKTVEQREISGILTMSVHAPKKRIMSQELTYFLSQVCDKLGVSKGHRDKLGLFTCDRLEPMSMGTLDTSFGGSVGLPVYFNWSMAGSERAEKVDLSTLRQMSLYLPLIFRLGPWEPFKNMSSFHEALAPEEIEELESAFHLSDEAKCFAMALEVARLEVRKSFYVMIAVLGPYVMAVLTAARVSQWISSGTPTAARRHLVIIYPFIAFLHAFAALQFSSIYDAEIDAAAAEKVSTVPEFAAAAEEYYDKMEKRGKLLRKGALYGDYYIDEEGTLLQYWYRAKKPSPAERKKFFQDKLESSLKPGTPSTKRQ